MIRPKWVNDDGTHGALGEGALRGFQLELEVKWVESLGATCQLAGSLVRQATARHQPSIWRLGGVVATGDPRAEADLLRQSADRVQEVHVVAREVMHMLQCR